MENQNSQAYAQDRHSPEDRIPFLIEIGGFMLERLQSGQSVLADNAPPISFAPYNGGSGARFKDINQLILAQQAKDNGYESPVWLTYNQAKNLQGVVKKDETETCVQFVSWKHADRSNRTSPGYSPYGVFNLDQITGIDHRKLKRPIQIDDIDRQAMALIYQGITPKNDAMRIGNWMAAAYLQVKIDAARGVEIPALVEQLERNNAVGKHSHIFRLANQGEEQVKLLAKTLTDFKQKVLQHAIETASIERDMAKVKPKTKRATKAKAQTGTAGKRKAPVQQ